MAVVFRSVLRWAIFAALALNLTHCSTLSKPRKPAIPLAPPHLADTVAAADAAEERRIDEEFDPEFRLESLRHDLAKTFTKTKAIPKVRSAEDAQISRLPVKRLVPEWKPIVPEGELEDEMADESALPRYAIPDEPSETKLSHTEHEPGTVAESSAEMIDELYEAEVHFRAGRLDRGLVALRRFLERDPRHAYADRAERRIAQAHLDAGEWTLAIAAANRCAINFPGTLSAHDAVHIRAKALKALGYPVASSADRH